MNAGPEITPWVSESSGKLILSCNISAQHPGIKGHKWIHKEKVVQEDNNGDTSTSYT